MGKLTFIEQNSEQFNSVSECISAVRSYQEQLDTNINNAVSFFSRDESELTGESLVLMVPNPEDTKESISVLLSDRNYKILLDGVVEEMQLPTIDPNVTITLTADEVLDRVEDTVSEMKTISEFINCALSSAATAATDFISSIAAKYKGISGVVLNKYQNLWDSSSPMQSIKNLFYSINNMNYNIDGDGNLHVFGKNGYQYETTADLTTWMFAKEIVPAVMSIDLTKFWNWFTLGWTFVTKVATSIFNVVKQLISSYFYQLKTNYTSGGNTIGILDVPLGQIPICSVWVRHNQDGTKTILAPGDPDNPLLPSNAAIVPCCALEEGNLLYASRLARSTGNTIQDTANKLYRRGWSQSENFLSNNIVTAPSSISSLGGEIFDFEDIACLSSITSQVMHISADTGDVVLSTHDVVIPTSNSMPAYIPHVAHDVIKFMPVDTLLRIGAQKVSSSVQGYDKYALILQIYPLTEYNNIKSYNDRQLCCIWHDTALALGYYFASNYWCILGGNNYPSDSDFDLLAYSFAHFACSDGNIDRDSEPVDGTYGLISSMALNSEIKQDSDGHVVSDDFNYIMYLMSSPIQQWNNRYARNTVMLLRTCVKHFALMLPYTTRSGIKSPDYDNPITERFYLGSSLADGSCVAVINSNKYLSFCSGYPHENYVMERLTLDYASNFSDDVSMHATHNYMDFITAEEDYNATVSKRGSFLPYSKYYLYGISTHYQTDYERWEEFKKVVRNTLIAVAGVTLAIVAFVWAKKRIVNTNLLMAKVDKLSWDVAGEPSKANIAAYNKARRKANRMIKLNGILGISSSTDDSVSILSSTQALANQLFGLQSNDDEESSKYTVKHVVNLIQG